MCVVAAVLHIYDKNRGSEENLNLFFWCEKYHGKFARYMYGTVEREREARRHKKAFNWQSFGIKNSFSYFLFRFYGVKFVTE